MKFLLNLDAMCIASNYLEQRWRRRRLTGVLGDEHGGAAEVAGGAIGLGALPVAVEGVGGMRQHGVRQEARARRQD